MKDKLSPKYLLLIDGSSLLSTQYYGNLPRQITFAKTKEEKEMHYDKIMQTSSGIYTNAVYGFLRAFLKIIQEQKPTHVVVSWDISRDTFRRKIYEKYKGNRDETPAPLKAQFILCQEILKEMGIRQFMDKEYEADDFCGSLSTKFENEISIRILTKDNDYLQLVSENTRLWLMFTTTDKADEFFNKYGIEKELFNIPEKAIELTPLLVKEEFGVTVDQIVDLKALKGDTSDNIPGVKGVGETSAIPLINEYGTIENLYGNIRNLDKKEEKEIKEFWKNSLGIKRSPLAYLLKEKDENDNSDEPVGEESAILSKKLGKIKCDIDLGNLTIDDLLLNINKEKTSEQFERLEFKSLKI